MAAHLSKHSELLNRTAAYPSTNYPGREQEAVLTHLLRKKLEPQVETWASEGRESGTTEASAIGRDEDLWKWAVESIQERVAAYVMEESNDDFTVEEREQGIGSVNTGLKRRPMDDESSEDEDDEDEDMEDVSTGAGGQSAGHNGPGLGPVRAGPNGLTRKKDEIWRLAAGGKYAARAVA